MDENGKKNFLERLRASDEKTKRKIIIIISCICMAIIIYVWFGYFNSLVVGATRPMSVNIQNTPVPQTSSSGFWDGVENNAGVFYQKISSVFDNFFQGSKQYKIQPQH
jgi:hypothetical protein